jgi:hypothetical protein
MVVGTKKSLARAETAVPAMMNQAMAAANISPALLHLEMKKGFTVFTPWRFLQDNPVPHTVLKLFCLFFSWILTGPL